MRTADDTARQHMVSASAAAIDGDVVAGSPLKGGVLLRSLQEDETPTPTPAPDEEEATAETPTPVAESVEETPAVTPTPVAEEDGGETPAPEGMISRGVRLVYRTFGKTMGRNIPGGRGYRIRRPRSNIFRRLW